MMPLQKPMPVLEKQAFFLLRTLSLGLLLSLACSLPAAAAGQASAEKAQPQEATQAVPANRQTAPARQKVTQGGITVQFEAGRAGESSKTKVLLPSWWRMSWILNARHRKKLARFRSEVSNRGEALVIELMDWLLARQSIRLPET